jgi:hypothetical protein
MLDHPHGCGPFADNGTHPFGVETRHHPQQDHVGLVVGKAADGTRWITSVDGAEADDEQSDRRS